MLAAAASGVTAAVHGRYADQLQGDRQQSQTEVSINSNPRVGVQTVYSGLDLTSTTFSVALDVHYW